MHNSYPNVTPGRRIAPAIYDAARVAHRARIIGYGIDARKQRCPGETPYFHAPQAGQTFRLDAAAKVGVKDYNLDDFRI